jgi:branched-chain amino acid transport system substrate-binding protein
MIHRTKALVALVTAAGLAFAACGSDKKSESTSAPTTAASSTAAPTTAGGAPTTAGSETTAGSATTAGGPTTLPAKATGDPFVLGVLARLSGTGSVSYQGVEPAAKAWESWTNDHGGINGHPVSVKLADAAGDAAKGLTLLKGMVENDKIQFLHIEDPTNDQAIQPYTAEQKLGVASAFLPAPLWNTTANWFAMGFNAVQDGYEYYFDVIKDKGFKSIGAVVCAEVAACAAADAQLAKYAPSYNMRYDGTLKLAASAPNYTAECLSLKEKGTEVLLVAFSIDTTKRVVADCATQDYHPTFIFPGTVLNDRAKELPDITAYDALPAIPWYADVPALKDYKAAIAQYQAGKSIDMPGVYTWAALQMFAEGVGKANLPVTATKEQVNTAIAANKTNVGGIVPDLSFTDGQPSPVVKCYFAAEYSKGEFLLPAGDKPVCPAG